MSLNKVILVGRLGRDPEHRLTSTGVAVVNMSLATSRWAGKDRPHETEWHRVVIFGKSAENCHKFLKKGSQAAIEGRIQTRSWTDGDGEKCYMTEVLAERVTFMTPPRTQNSKDTQNTQTTESEEDLDIPF